MPAGVTDETKSADQTYYEEVEELKVAGLTSTEAVHQIAQRHGKSVNVIRGLIYRYKAHLSSEPAAATAAGTVPGPTTADPDDEPGTKRG